MEYRPVLSDFDPAIARLTDLIPQSSTPEVQYQARGILYYRKGEYGKALEDFALAEETARSVASVFYAIFRRAEYLADQNMLDKAKSELLKFKPVKSELSEENRQLIKKLKQAIRERKNPTKPKLPVVYFGGSCGDGEASYKIHEAAFREMEKEQKEREENPIAHAEKLKERFGSEEALIDHFQNSEISPGDGPAFFARAQKKFAQASSLPEKQAELLFASALEDINRVISLNQHGIIEKSPHIWCLRSHIYFQLDQVEKALEDIEKALFLDPENASYIKAKKIISAEPTKGSYRIDAEIIFKEGEKKLDLIQKELSLKGDSPKKLFKKVELLCMLGKIEEARAEMPKLQELISSDHPLFPKVAKIALALS